MRELVLAGLRTQFPSAQEPELRARLAVRLYGRPAAERMFDSVPADAR